MNNTTKITVRQEENQGLRELIDLIKEFPVSSQKYWIISLNKQGQISGSVAGRLLITLELI